MSGSILNDTKKILGVPEDYHVFDLDILIHINGVLATLNQLGIGPLNGYGIEDSSAQWVDFMTEDPRLASVKTYVYLRVRILFDPPATANLLTAMKEQAQELEWRLEVARNPVVPAAPIGYGGNIIDGGDAG